MATQKLEVHEHIFVSGPRSRGMFLPAIQKTTSHFSHSHEGGDIPHTHPDTGPASYTIDKDEWLARTGLKGGGQKKFTAKPTGEQLPFIARDEADLYFAVVVGPPPAGFRGEGAGIAPIVRMELACGLRVGSITPAKGC